MWQELEKDFNLKTVKWYIAAVRFVDVLWIQDSPLMISPLFYFCTVCVAECNMFILTVLNSNLMCVPVMFAFVKKKKTKKKNNQKKKNN